MKFIIISDTHIKDENEPIYQDILRLIEANAAPQTALIFLGDIFDLFIGAKPVFINRYRLFFEALKKSNKNGTKIHYVEGNHDFLISKAFSDLPEVLVHERSFSEKIGDKRFYFSHGDLIDQDDRGYLFLRSLLRSAPIRKIEPIVPGEMIDWIGRKSSELSKKKRGGFEAVDPKNRDFLRTKYHTYAYDLFLNGYDYAVMGHCHDLDEKIYDLGSRKTQYINVGYPKKHGFYLEWNSGQEFVERRPLNSKK